MEEVPQNAFVTVLSDTYRGAQKSPAVYRW